MPWPESSDDELGLTVDSDAALPDLKQAEELRWLGLGPPLSSSDSEPDEQQRAKRRRRETNTEALGLGGVLGAALHPTLLGGDDGPPPPASRIEGATQAEASLLAMEVQGLLAQARPDSAQERPLLRLLEQVRGRAAAAKRAAAGSPALCSLAHCCAAGSRPSAASKLSSTSGLCSCNCPVRCCCLHPRTHPAFTWAPCCLYLPTHQAFTWPPRSLIPYTDCVPAARPAHGGGAGRQPGARTAGRPGRLPSGEAAVAEWGARVWRAGGKAGWRHDVTLPWKRCCCNQSTVVLYL